MMPHQYSISLEASFVNDLGEIEIAEASLAKALEIYRNLGDPHLQGRTLLQMGDTIGHVNPERGLAHIRKALVLIDPAREARLLLCAEHDLAWYLNDLGQPEDALAVLNRARPLYRQFPDRRTQLRLHWLEGRIAFRLGDYTEAETIFAQLWDDFRARDLQHDLVLLSIDLAEVLVSKGEHARAEELIGQCQPILASWGLHRYALAAWLMLQQAIGERQAGAIFGQIREYYRRYWVRPAPFGGLGGVPELVPCPPKPSLEQSDTIQSRSQEDCRMPATPRLEIPQDVLDSARMTADHLLIELAVHLYAQGRLSLGKAHELAGLSLWEFRQTLGLRRIAPHFEAKDLAQDLETLRYLNRQ